MTDVLIRIRAEGGDDSAAQADQVSEAIGQIETVSDQVAIAVLALVRALDALGGTTAADELAKVSRENEAAAASMAAASREAERQEGSLAKAGSAVAKFAVQHGVAIAALEGGRRALAESRGETQRLAQVVAATSATQAKAFATLKVAAVALAGTLLTLAAAAAAVAAAIAAIHVARRVEEIARAGAQMEPIITAFDRLAVSVGATGERLLDDLRRGTRGTLPDLELMRQAVIALNAEAVESGEQFVELTALARILGQTVGVETADAIQHATRGIATQNPILLKNLGVLVSVADANREYAAEVGKSVGQLTSAERREAFRAAVLGRMRDAVARVTAVEATRSAELERLMRVQEQLIPGTEAYARVQSRIAVETAAVAGASELLADSIQALDTVKKNLVQRMKQAFAASPQLRKAFSEFNEVVQRLVPILELQVKKMAILGQAAGLTARPIIGLARAWIALHESAKAGADRLAQAINPFGQMNREAQRGLAILRAYREGVDEIAPPAAMEKVGELQERLGDVNARLDEFRSASRGLGREARMEFALLIREARELDETLKVLRSRATRMPAIEIPIRAEGMAAVLGGLDPEHVHSQLESAKRQVERFQAEHASLRLAEVSGRLIDEEEFDRSLERLDEAQAALERWRALAEAVGPALADAVDLSGVDLSGLERPMARLRDQIAQTKEESIEARDRLAQVLAEVARAPQGSERWKTLTEEVKRSREEVERMEARLGALGDRADEIVGRRAADLGRIMAEIELQAPQIAVRGMDTGELTTRLSQAQEEITRLSVEMSGLRRSGGGTTEEMVALEGAMERARERVAGLRQSLDSLDFSSVSRITSRPISLGEEIHSVERALESMKDAFGAIDPAMLEAGARQLERAGASAAQIQNMFARLDETMAHTSAKLAAAAVGIGSAFEAMIRGSDRLAESLVRAATSMIQTQIQLEAQRRAAAGMAGAAQLGMFGVGIGVVGGILGAIIASQRDRKQEVVIDSLSARAEAQMQDRHRGPERLVLQIVGSDGRIEETEYILRRRQARDAAVRVPRGVSFGGKG